MYKIYKIRYWARLPIHNVVSVFKYLNFEGEPDYQFNSLTAAINTLKTTYKKIVTQEPYNGGIKYTLCGIVDSLGNVIAVLNLDNNICLVNSVQEGE